MTIIDAHAHLWLRQDAVVDGLRVRPIEGNKSRAMFLGQEVQMLPPWLTDGENSAERFLSNMDYAQVAAAVVTQEFIDGPQNDYLLEVQRRYPERLFCFGMPRFFEHNGGRGRNEWPEAYDEGLALIERGFRGLKIPAARLIGPDWRVRLDSPLLMRLFHLMEERGTMLAVELAEGAEQVAEMETVISQCPRLTVVIGHFGMVSRPGWMQQIRLALHPNVYVESGGITWLFHSEFWPYPSAVRAIREAADAVGIGKLMWGSDYPRTITAITYRMSYDFVLNSPLLSDKEKAAFLGLNAQRLFGFGPMEPMPYYKNMSE